MPSILITGTTSGIGLAATLLFARNGWDVYAGVRNKGRADDLLAGFDPLVGAAEGLQEERRDRVDPVDAAVAEPDAVLVMSFPDRVSIDGFLRETPCLTKVAQLDMELC